MRDPAATSESLSMQPFRLDPARPSGWRARIAERVLGLTQLQDWYEQVPRGLDPGAFARAALDLLEITRMPVTDAATAVPRTGPLIIVSNHPFGGLDGLVLLETLTALRSDLRVMANLLLGRIPELAPILISVDPFGGQRALRRNVAPLREAARWVTGGGALLIYPSGEVSHPQLRERRIADPAWSPVVARLVQLTRAPVLPLYVEGRNRWRFHAAGLLHPRLRTLMLARELIARRGSSVSLCIGRVIPAAHMEEFVDPAELARYLRSRTYLLGSRARGSRAARAPRHERQRAPAAPLCIATPASHLRNEIAALPAASLLTQNGALAVHLAEAISIPWVLQEIGRLRELTFRAAGEGTGKSSDLSLFDAYYLHLFIWNREREEIVGAYRVGRCDAILERYGKRGLYTYSLFDYRDAMLGRMSPALELGRSFIRPEYQRGFSPLLLLWRGIGAFVAENPRYRYLFGPVTISADYDEQSRQLLVDFLSATAFDEALSRHVRPRRPMRGRSLPPALTRDLSGRFDLEGLSDLIGQIEPDQKGAPVLLRQYLKLGGRLLGFNVDEDFGDALDGLIVVDLCRTDPRLLARYLGEDGARRFREHHRNAGDLQQAS